MGPPATFETALRRAYRGAPCEVLPNALWKTLARLPDLEAAYGIRDGRVAWLAMWRHGEMHPYWHRAAKAPRMCGRAELATEPAEGPCLAVPGPLRFALVHDRYLGAFPLSGLKQREAYFRLRHDLEEIPVSCLPPGYALAPARPLEEAEDVALLIAACYDDMRPSSEEVRSWTKHPVYAADLWIWAVAPDGQRVGLAVGELDGTVPEMSLEWVQVLPDHRGLGLGSVLVSEILRRATAGVAFATVSGRADDPLAERLYRRCGFAGDDLWWVLRP